MRSPSINMTLTILVTVLLMLVTLKVDAFQPLGGVYASSLLIFLTSVVGMILMMTEPGGKRRLRIGLLALHVILGAFLVYIAFSSHEENLMRWAAKNDYTASGCAKRGGQMTVSSVFGSPFSVCLTQTGETFRIFDTSGY